MADSKSYALLDIHRQLKIPLTTISSRDGFQEAACVSPPLNFTEGPDIAISRNISAAHNLASLTDNGADEHTRSASPEARPSCMQGSSLEVSPGPSSEVPQSSTAPQLFPTHRSPLGLLDNTTPGPLYRNVSTKPEPNYLKPHIVSPTPEEFLVVTGTGPSDPGIGLFVNLDGDPTRPTIKFDQYPCDIVIDEGFPYLPTSYPAPFAREDRYVIASMTKNSGTGLRHGLEIHRLTDQVVEPESTKFWLEIVHSSTLGIASLSSWGETYFSEVVDRLRLRKFSPFVLGSRGTSIFPRKIVDLGKDASTERVCMKPDLFDRDADIQSEDPLPLENWESRRNLEEEKYASRFARAYSRLAVWSGNRIWWATLEPLLLRLDTQLDTAYAHVKDASRSTTNRRAIFCLLNSIRGRDARSEFEFVSFNYIRQRAGIMLLDEMLHTNATRFSDTEIEALEEVLTESSLDARVVISLIPSLRHEVLEDHRGIWMFDGVRRTAERYLRSNTLEQPEASFSTLGVNVVQFLRRFLSSWRKKKGFGSVPDDSEVFRSVDAALLTVLLELDRSVPDERTSGPSQVRTELYDMVDKGVDCFERAVSLLESYHRLFVLSRLYQSRKMTSHVLATWRRIIDGERDDGGELSDGETRIRDYLTKISDPALIHEYGIWLANRNPILGVQVFADSYGRASKFEPTKVVAILRAEAPNAIKYYLEDLVFGKGYKAFVQDLINYYLDIIIGELKSSETCRMNFAATYVAYRALQTPKPTYQQFLIDNTPNDDEVWQNRLRLLELLNGSSQYNSSAIQKRIASLPDELLVPETIILAGLEQQHENAVRLLVHKLGDYDTAISYCIRGGSSIYAPSVSGGDHIPTYQMQARLFRVVLEEFLSIEDISDRIGQTASLLERFEGWFELDYVLALIPDNWSARVISSFLVRSMRTLVQQRRASSLEKSLSSAENVRIGCNFISSVEDQGPSTEASQ